ncbi:MAG: PstS family phosphate ABC transporter substrate-binding protein [Fimbriimonadaceae bacterium]
MASLLTALVAAGSLVLSGCGKSEQASGAGSQMSGLITIDGSSTVYPILEAVAEEFMRANPGVRITIGVSGTGGGFKKFFNGEIDIANASRPIKPEEIELGRRSGIDFIELPVAFDGLSVVVNKSNTFVDYLTVSELRRIWEPNSTVRTWRDVRPEWPAERIMLYGAGTDSGTFDYFTEAIVGTAKASRRDYTPSEDDNLLVQGVAGDRFSLGYFGFAYYDQNRDRVRSVPIDNEKGGPPVSPSLETIQNNTYNPLSRPLLLYVSSRSVEKPQVRAFVEFLLKRGSPYIAETGFVPLPQSALDLVLEHFQSGKMGTVFANRNTVGLTIEDIIRFEGGAPKGEGEGEGDGR